MIRKLSLFVMLISFLLLSSCSLRQAAPQVRLVGLQIEDATLFETTLLVEIRVENDSAQEIDIAGAVHKLYINGEYVGKGFDKKGFVLPRLDSVVVPVTVFVNNISLLTKLQNMAKDTMLSYKVESRLHTKIPRTPFKGRSSTAVSEGTVSFGQLTTRAIEANSPSL